MKLPYDQTYNALVTTLSDMLFTDPTESLTEVGHPDEDTWTPVRLTPNDDKSLWP